MTIALPPMEGIEWSRMSTEAAHPKAVTLCVGHEAD
jgi:hypothetical protein